MAYTIYGTPLRPGYCEVHPDVRQPYPCDEDRRDDYEERRPPSDEEICGSGGHAYHGDDGQRGRCYCGHAEYPFGGPQKEEK